MVASLTTPPTGTHHSAKSLRYAGDAVDFGRLDGHLLTGRADASMIIVSSWASQLPRGSASGQVYEVVNGRHVPCGSNVAPLPGAVAVQEELQQQHVSGVEKVLRRFDRRGREIRGKVEPRLASRPFWTDIDAAATTRAALDGHSGNDGDVVHAEAVSLVKLVADRAGVVRFAAVGPLPGTAG